MNDHVLHLGLRLHKANGHLWKAFLGPHQYLVFSSGPCYPGSRREAAFVIQYSYPAWHQTEDVISTMKYAQAMNQDKDDMDELWLNFQAALDF